MWRNYADRGTYAEFKRRRSSQSSEEGETNEAKRGRLTVDINPDLDNKASTESERFIDEIADDTTMATEDDIERIILKVTQVLTKQYQDTTKRVFEGIKEVQRRVNKLEDGEKTQNAEIDEIKHHLDDYDQRDKDKNVIVTGLTNEQLETNQAIKVLNDNLNHDVRKEEIET